MTYSIIQKKKKLIWWILFFIFAADSLCLFPQKDNIRFKHISIEKGLAEVAIYCMLQDCKGFMWFGTQDGLNRYDGYEFKVYKPKPDDPKTISDVFILSIFEDKEKNLWVGTKNGLNKFDRKTERFTRYLQGKDTQNNVSCIEVKAIGEDLEGNIWAGTDTGLYKLDPETNRIKHYSKVNNKLNCNDVRAVLVDKSGIIWIGTFGGGLARFEEKRDRFIQFPAPNGLSSYKVLTLYEDKTGLLWVGTEGGGLNLYNKTTNQFTQYQSNEKDKNSLSHNDITSICEDQEGILWIGTMGGGINTFNRENERFMRYKNEPGIPHSLGYDYILSIFEDESGLIWIGTYGRGLDIFDRNIQAFSLYIHNSAKPRNTLSDNTVWAIHEDSSGILWIGTEGRGLNRFDRKAGSFIHYTTQTGHLKKNGVRSILESKNGELWIGNYGGGVYRMHIKEKTIKIFKHYQKEESDESLSNDWIMVIYEDSAGDFWIGTKGGGLNKMIDKEKGIFKRYNTENKKLNHNQVFSIYEDRQGVLWVGTYGGGLHRYDRKNDRFIPYIHAPMKSESLSHNRVRCIYEDQSGVLWIGTDGGGLNKMTDRELGIFKIYREEQGLPNNVIYGILEDSQENLWISTNQGISKYNPKEKDEKKLFKNYDVEDGLQCNEFNQGAYFKNPKTGEMFFGGVNGFNSFFPDKIKNHDYIPHIVIDNFFLHNDPVEIEPEGKDSLLRNAIHETDSLTLSHNQDFFSFEFAALHFASPQKNQYKYRLEGYDNDWILTDSGNRRATYTNLWEGAYVFRVKGSNKDGIWNEKGTSIKIKILPPLWRTWWAYFIYALVLLLIILIFFRFTKILENRVEARTRELNVKKKELEKKHRDLKNAQNQLVQSEKMAALGTLVVGVGHEISNPSSFSQTSAYNLGRDLEKLKAFLIELAGNEADEEILKVFDEKFSVLFGHLDVIKESNSRISKTVSDLRTLSRMERREMKPVKLLDGLQSTINLVKTQYKEQIKFITEFQSDPEIEGNAAALNQVFTNVIVNACQAIMEKQKISEESIKGTLTIKTQEKDNQAIILFHDTGIGMSAEVKNKIFDPYFTTKPVGKGTGLGLAISLKIIKEHHGDIKVESKEGEGSTVTLYFPLQNKKNIKKRRKYHEYI